VLFIYDASSLFCSSLMIFYTMMFRFDFQFKDERCFLCTCDARDCNVCRAAFSCSMIVIHCAEKYVMKERCTRWEDRVWLYWVTLFFSWFDLCHVDVEWIVSINMRSQSFNVWLWSMKENAFWSFSWALDFSRRQIYDLTSSKEGELKLSQYISVIDESLLLRAL